jgi:hypothetical protein
VSKEWTEGVLPVLLRAAARDTRSDRKWLVFDGPVDAIWVSCVGAVRVQGFGAVAFPAFLASSGRAVRVDTTPTAPTWLRPSACPLVVTTPD